MSFFICFCCTPLHPLHPLVKGSTQKVIDVTINPAERLKDGFDGYYVYKSEIAACAESFGWEAGSYDVKFTLTVRGTKETTHLTIAPGDSVTLTV